MAGCNYKFNEKIEFLGDINGQDQTYQINIGSAYQLTDILIFRTNIVDLFQTSNDGRFITFGIATSKFL